MLRVNLTYNEKEYILDKKIGIICRLSSFVHGKYDLTEMKNAFKSTLLENLEVDALAKDLTMKVVLTIDNNEKDFLKNEKKNFPYNVRIYQTCIH